MATSSTRLCAPGGGEACYAPTLVAGAAASGFAAFALPPASPAPGGLAPAAAPGNLWAALPSAPNVGLGVDPWDLALAAAWMSTPPDLLHGWKGGPAVGPPGAEGGSGTRGGAAAGTTAAAAQTGGPAPARPRHCLGSVAPVDSCDAWEDVLALDGPLCDVGEGPLDGLVDELFAARREGSGSVVLEGGRPGTNDDLPPQAPGCLQPGCITAFVPMMDHAPDAYGHTVNPYGTSGAVQAWDVVVRAGAGAVVGTTHGCASLKSNPQLIQFGDLGANTQEATLAAPGPTTSRALAGQGSVEDQGDGGGSRAGARASKRRRGAGAAEVVPVDHVAGPGRDTQEEPAASESEDGSKGNRCLPERAIRLLKEWLLSPEHVRSPYPTREERAELAERTGITMKQVAIWFTNARKRVWAPLHCPNVTARKCGPRATATAAASTLVPAPSDGVPAASGEVCESPMASGFVRISTTLPSCGPVTILHHPGPLPTPTSLVGAGTGSGGSSSVDGGSSTDLLASLQARKGQLLQELAQVDTRLSYVLSLIEGKKRPAPQ